MSLYDLAKESLTLSLLKLRPSSLPQPRKSTNSSLSGLMDRLKSCRGVEVLHLISALPHSGLRPDLLEIFETNHAVIRIFFTNL